MDEAQMHDTAQRLRILSSKLTYNPSDRHLCYEAAKALDLAANRIADLKEDLRIVVEAE